MGKKKGFDGTIEYFDEESGVDYELHFDYTLNVLHERLDLEHWEAHKYGQDKEELIQDELLSSAMEDAIRDELEKEALTYDWDEERYLAGADE